MSKCDTLKTKDEEANLLMVKDECDPLPANEEIDPAEEANEKNEHVDVNTKNVVKIEGNSHLEVKEEFDPLEVNGRNDPLKENEENMVKKEDAYTILVIKEEECDPLDVDSEEIDEALDRSTGNYVFALSSSITFRIMKVSQNTS